MEKWYYLLIIPGYFFFINLYRYLRIKYYEEQHLRWISGESIEGILQTAPIVRKLIREAGIKDKYLPVAQPMGFGQLATFKSSILERYPTKLEVYAQEIYRMFQEAIAVYRSRMLNSLNPFCWINCIIFLPKSIIQYLGLSAESIITKILNLIWWLISGYFMLMRTLYPDATRGLLEKIFQLFL